MEKPVNKLISKEIVFKSNDQDLVELAGLHAYKEKKVDSYIKVNDTKYRVLNTQYNHPTGLDALTVRNETTKEITIVYVGTDAAAENGKQDLLTDAQLLSDLTLPQLEAAQDYFNKMNKKYESIGGVKSVTGNSLGGPLANSVAINHPEVTSVTLNPALLPKGMADPNKTYENITNYFTNYDVLTGTLIALNLDSRIPGKRYDISTGIPVIGEKFSILTNNHTGYTDGGKYVIGLDGEPGYGEIHVEADAHIMTSIWTGEPLYGGHSDRIEINRENLNLLAEALAGDVATRLGYAQDYLTHSQEIAQHEGDRYSERLSRLQMIFEDSFENLIGNPLFIGITTTGHRLTSEIDHLISLLNMAENASRSLNGVLNSPPVELVEHLFNRSVSVESIFGQARNQLLEFKQEITSLTGFLQNILHKEIPELFSGGKETLEDLLVNEMLSHYEIIKANSVKMNSHIAEFQSQVGDLAKNFGDRDSSLSASISGGGSVPHEVVMPKKNDYVLEASHHMLIGMKVKEIYLDGSFEAFKGISHRFLLPLLGGLTGLAFAIESTLEVISAQIKGAMNIALSGTVPGKLISIFSDFDDKIRSYVSSALEPIDELAATIEGLRDGLTRLTIGFPALLDSFRPYIDSAIFDLTSYSNIHIYNVSAMAIHEEMEMLFDDIVHQLSQHKGNSIQALCEISQRVKDNMIQLRQQVDRVTL
ncbi:SA1320 family protein [Rossellomorea sp. GCM10028870]|uniref:SA1320 family protein n=1 Tax=Rossellomorea sp. GCM10028870 TaxID=3273426 RepID=UPI00361132B5